MCRRINRDMLYDAMARPITPISKGLDDARRKGATCQQTKKLAKKLRDIEQRLAASLKRYQNDRSVRDDLRDMLKKQRTLQGKMCSVRKHHTSLRDSNWLNDMGVLPSKKSL